MKANTIMVAVDFSEASAAALEYAEMLARDTGAKLLIAYCLETVSTYDAGGFYLPELDQSTEEADALLSTVLPKDANVRYEHRLVLGRPGEQLVRLATDAHADLIVMGTHGRRGVTRLLMGSVAEEVVRRAPCPVLTLRPHQPQAAPATTT